MSMPQCRFCDHTNPAAAKFCNECGSPLHLTPCRHCEAINDRGARTCYQCGTADPALAIAPDHAVEPALAVAPYDVVEPALAAAGDDAIEPALAVAPDDAVAPAGEVVDTIPAGVSQASPRWPLQSRVATAVLLSALAVAAYYAYRNPEQLTELLSATSPTVSLSGSDTPTTSVRGTSSAPASSAPTGSDGAASVAAIGPAVRSPANEPATDPTISPARQDGMPATGAATVDGQTPPSNQTLASVTSQPQVSRREPEISPPRAPHVEKKPPTESKAAKKSKKTSTKKPAPAQAKVSSKASTMPIETPKTASGK